MLKVNIGTRATLKVTRRTLAPTSSLFLRAIALTSSLQVRTGGTVNIGNSAVQLVVEVYIEPGGEIIPPGSSEPELWPADWPIEEPAEEEDNTPGYCARPATGENPLAPSIEAEIAAIEAREGYIEGLKRARLNYSLLQKEFNRVENATRIQEGVGQDASHLHKKMRDLTTRMEDLCLDWWQDDLTTLIAA